MKNYILGWKTIAVLTVIVGVVGFFETGIMISQAPRTVVYEGACTIEPTDKALNAICGDLKYTIKDSGVIAQYMLAQNAGKNDGIYCNATHRAFDDEIEWSCTYGKPEEKK